MNDTTHRELARRKARIHKRLGARQWKDQPRPMLAARNIRYEVDGRTPSAAAGSAPSTCCPGTSACRRPSTLTSACSSGTCPITRHESDHVLNPAYNVLAGGTCIEDLELLRNDEAYLDALGASRIPDPTTAGDFCRRFEDEGAWGHGGSREDYRSV